MKATINGVRYNTDSCEVLGEKDHYNYSNNYSGTTRLLRAANGTLLVWCDTNGQDLYMSDYLELFSQSPLSIDDFEMDEEQEKRCLELGLVETDNANELIDKLQRRIADRVHKTQDLALLESICETLQLKKTL